MKYAASILAALVVLLVTGVAYAAEAVPLGPSHFGRMFGDLPGFHASDADTMTLAASMLDPNLPINDNPAHLGSGETYWLQQLDHDLTKDPLPASQLRPHFPVETLVNGRTFAVDLDSVYCGGPGNAPAGMYAADGKHFVVQEPNANGVRDLPRNPDGSAILCEGRNDENEVITQAQVALLKFHNALIDEGMSFQHAQRVVIHHWQWIVLHELLPELVGQDTIDAAMTPSIYTTRPQDPPYTPVEWSVGSFRSPHSIVRLAYFMNENSGKVQVFNATGNDLRGGRPIPAGLQIEWDNFLDDLGHGGDPDFNVFRKFDPLVSRSLFNLPIGPLGAEADGSVVLAFRNMARADSYDLPSGQDVARALGVTPISASEIAATMPASIQGAFSSGTPLWYYGLYEANQQTNGQRLGTVAGRVVAEPILGALRRDHDSIVNIRGFKPDADLAAVAGDPNEFTLADLVTFAGVTDDQ